MSEVSQDSCSSGSGVLGQFSTQSQKPTLQVTKLAGTNYAWSHSALCFIKSKWKMGYIDGSVAEPKSIYSFLLNGMRRTLLLRPDSFIPCNLRSAMVICY
ncbi:unnamed protein product [Ilex paraguariensis]|uniref:Retrotransposon Copia-like N-terminal domain-containing protein n=1 Tax=Ilex paraguariensis TaxID=185542 RepID=A0ABC8TWC5_9AQUA